jgi:hypothetical protein
MLNSLTHTQRDIAQKGASSASKSILPAVNIQVMAPTYHGKACGSHATLSSESGSISYFQMHKIQFVDLEPLNLQMFVPASLSVSLGCGISRALGIKNPHCGQPWALLFGWDGGLVCSCIFDLNPDVRMDACSNALKL